MDEEAKDGRVDERRWLWLNSTGCTVSVASPARHIPRGPIPRALFIRSINPSYRLHPRGPHAHAYSLVGIMISHLREIAGDLWRRAIPDPPRLWRIADFSSLRLVINIEFFHGKVRRDEDGRGASVRCVGNFLAVVLTEEWYVLL